MSVLWDSQLHKGPAVLAELAKHRTEFWYQKSDRKERRALLGKKLKENSVAKERDSSTAPFDPAGPKGARLLKSDTKQIGDVYC